MCTVVEPDTTTESFAGCEEARQLRETIRQLESVAETRAEVLRNLRLTIGLPDVIEEEEQW